MTRSLTTGRLAVTAAHAAAALAVHAPSLAGRFTDALPAAAGTVGRRLRGALVREDIGDARARHSGQGTAHGFDRVEFAAAGVDDPAELLTGPPAAGFLAEIHNAVVNLAIAMARQPVPRPEMSDSDATAIAYERLAVAGHNLHPCGRTRLGWDTSDVLAHDLESAHTPIGFVAVRDDGHLGDDVGAALSGPYPQIPAAPPGYRVQPVHVWQRDAILPRRYADLLAGGALRILNGEIDAVATGALRTLLLPPGTDGRRRYLKVSLDIQVTSTRRSISVASTRNGPVVSALLHRLVAEDPDGDRLVLLAEPAGAAVPAGSGRDLSAILRDGLTGRLADDEVAVPGSALPAVDPATGRTVLAGLVDTAGGDAVAWLDAYARLLLPPLLRLTVRGVAMEAHLQNCLPTFTGGRPKRLVLRDFAGLRLHLPRLDAQGLAPVLWPGSVVGTGDEGLLRAKIGYTALQAHLGELIIRLGESHGLAEEHAWRVVRAIIDETYAALSATPAARRDHAALVAPLVPHKALVRMRLTGGGDTYIPVRNPLHAP